MNGGTLKGAAPTADRPASGQAVEVVTFGCRLNACESEAMRERAARENLSDAVVFNTCAVTSEAVRQARQAIRRARRERPSARLIVTGCAAQIDPAAFAAMDEVDLVIGNIEKTAPGALKAGGPRVRVGDIATASGVGRVAAGFGGRARAYVEIQNGCDHRCTFCVIPFGRGAARSSTMDAVASRVAALARAGCSEVVLTGVDLTSWGGDIRGGPVLGDLIAHILAAVPSLPRLRLSSVDAAELDERLLHLMETEARLMPHLHLSLQSGDDLILKRMKRRHTRAQALALIDAVRRLRPDVAFGADFIAGFPTESDAAFENTMAFVDDARLAFLHVFPFSPRPETPAARMPQLPHKVIHDRAARLRAVGERALHRHLESKIGVRVSALVERPGRARDADFTEVVFEGDADPGSIIVGEVAGHDGRRARMDQWRTA